MSTGSDAFQILPLVSTPGLDRVNTEIFHLRYFGACMQCGFCHDRCCQYGADVNLAERDRILAEADALEPFLGHPKERWFKLEVKEDPDYPSGAFVRTQVVDGACVFLNRQGRGCLLHSWALQSGKDYHSIKPMVCWLFPVTWDRGLLRASYDVHDDLICKDQGVTLYQSSRGEIARWFGDPLVAELDEMERRLPTSGTR